MDALPVKRHELSTVRLAPRHSQVRRAGYPGATDVSHSAKTAHCTCASSMLIVPDSRKVSMFEIPEVNASRPSASASESVKPNCSFIFLMRPSPLPSPDSIESMRSSRLPLPTHFTVSLPFPSTTT